MTIPPFSIGRILALLALIVAVLTLIVPVSVAHVTTWLIVALCLAILIG